MIMKTSCELQKKLDKLPDSILKDNTIFALFITKVIWDSKNNKECTWYITYRDEADNILLEVQHSKLQAAVDNTLAALKQIN